MSYKDLVVATGSATLVAGTITYLNSAITPTSVVLTNLNALALAGAGLQLAAVPTLGQVVFTSVNALGVAVVADVYSFNFVVLQNNFVAALCG